MENLKQALSSFINLNATVMRSLESSKIRDSYSWNQLGFSLPVVRKRRGDPSGWRLEEIKILVDYFSLPQRSIVDLLNSIEEFNSKFCDLSITNQKKLLSCAGLTKDKFVTRRKDPYKWKVGELQQLLNCLLQMKLTASLTLGENKRLFAELCQPLG